MNWKDELNDYFIKNKMFRVKYLNDILHENLNEYALYIDQFNGIKANFKSINTHLLKDIKLGVIEIIVDTSSYPHKFNIECYFNELGNLCLKYPLDYDYNAKNSATFNPELKKDDYHLYNEDEINDLERIEKEFIFQLLNTRIINFIEANKKSQHS
jgi:hypothetical protein